MTTPRLEELAEAVGHYACRLFGREERDAAVARFVGESAASAVLVAVAQCSGPDPLEHCFTVEPQERGA